MLLEISGRFADTAAEIAKVRAKMKKSLDVAAKQRELMAREGFEKVNDVVMAAEKKQLDDALAAAAAANYERTIVQFEKMSIT